MVYTGTHDNNTVLGWYRSLDESTQDFVYELLKGTPEQDVVELMLARTFETRASLAIAPLQDILGLDASARMNTPGLAADNWHWRFDWSAIQSPHVSRIRKLIEKTGRLHEA